MLLLCACWCPCRTMMSGTKKDSSTCCDIRSSNSVGNTRRGIKGLHASIGGKAGSGCLWQAADNTYSPPLQRR